VLNLPSWAVERLACPRDASPLRDAGARVVCAQGHSFAVVAGVPVLLRDDVPQTHWIAESALRGEVDEEGDEVNGIDPFVQQAIGGTNGIMYGPLVNQLRDYPIPSLRIGPGGGRVLLDVGCNWGRWSLAAARAGYRAIGIDPSLPGILAARRVAARLGLDAAFVVGDARFLPLGDASVDVVFSYSVLQHLAKADVRLALEAIRRVLRPGGHAVVQMPNAYGLRSMYHQARRRFAEARAFEVRYWTPGELRSTFSQLIGPAEVSVDGFFSLNAQPADLPLLPRRYRAVVRASEALRRASRVVPGLWRVADSLYVTAERPPRHES